MFSRSGWSVLRSGSLAMGGTSKRRPSPHLHKVPTRSNKVSPRTFKTALINSLLLWTLEFVTVFTKVSYLEPHHTLTQFLWRSTRIFLSLLCLSLWSCPWGFPTKTVYTLLNSAHIKWSANLTLHALITLIFGEKNKLSISSNAILHVFFLRSIQSQHLMKRPKCSHVLQLKHLYKTTCKNYSSVYFSLGF
jgi:hypothetical protein